MTKAVMISIRPKWCDLIASGKKTIEVRKTRPKIEVPFKCYIYETLTNFVSKSFENDVLIPKKFRGKVIGEFMCDKIDRYTDEVVNASSTEDYSGWNDFELEKACIHPDDLEKYADGNYLYGWHISDLVIYDQPKELSEFYKAGFETMESLDEGLCKYCLPTDYGEHRCYSTPNGYVSCEGSFCCEAYQSYLDENFALIRPPQSWCYVEGVKTA